MGLNFGQADFAASSDSGGGTSSVSTALSLSPEPIENILGKCIDPAGLDPLDIVYPEGLDSVNDGWTEVLFTMDSGARDTVIGVKVCPEVEKVDSMGVHSWPKVRSGKRADH